MPAQRKHRKPAAHRAVEHAPEPAKEPAPVASLPGHELAALILDPRRAQPVVVVSFKADAGARRINAADLARRLAGQADVYEIRSGEETLNLAKDLPKDMAVFGDAARVYPAGAGWQQRIPPHRPFHPWTELGHLTRDILEDVRADSHAPPQAPRHDAARTTPRTTALTATGTVTGFALADNSRALLTLATSGAQAQIRAEDLLPGVPLNWLLTKGQQVTGLLDARNHTLNISALLTRPASPTAVYRDGEVALARVKSACGDHAVVELWPGLERRIGIERISSNELDSAEDLLTEGEVVRVRVIYDAGTLTLSMLDVDDDEPLATAPALVDGGPPWLDVDRPYASLFSPSANPSRAGDGTGATEAGGAGSGVIPAGEAEASASERKSALQTTQMALEHANHLIAELLAAAKRHGNSDKLARLWQDRYTAEKEKADELARQVHEAERSVEAVRTELARTKAALVEARQQRRSASSRSEPAAEALFLDPVEQFGFELATEWARTVPAVDKADQPLGDYTVGPGFLASLAAITAPQRAKSMRALVDLLANRDGPLRNRHPHVLRENEGAGAPPRMRGGDVCWRLYVEQGTAGALRLHYWKLKSGGIELHEVVTHDAVKP